MNMLTNYIRSEWETSMWTYAVLMIRLIQQFYTMVHAVHMFAHCKLPAKIPRCYLHTFLFLKYFIVFIYLWCMVRYTCAIYSTWVPGIKFRSPTKLGGKCRFSLSPLACPTHFLWSPGNAHTHTHIPHTHNNISLCVHSWGGNTLHIHT